MTPVAGESLRRELIPGKSQAEPVSARLFEVMRLLGCWTRHFRILLRALGRRLALFVLLLERSSTTSWSEPPGEQGRGTSDCAGHIYRVCSRSCRVRSRLAVVQSALRACIAEDGFSPQTGDVCASTQRVMNWLARLIGRIDSRIRSEKKIESGPLVCRAHIVHIVGIGRALCGRPGS